MFKALIIDDEPPSRNALSTLLRANFPDLNLVGEAKNVKSGLEQIAAHEPDLVFLDIQMPDGSGFDLLRQVRNNSFEIIFTTAHNEYALEAFRFSAVGYLLKPFSETELCAIVKRAIGFIQSRSDDRTEQNIALIENYERINSKMRRIVLPDQKGFIVFPVDEIIRLEADANYTNLILTNGRVFYSSYNLGWFEKMLVSQGFMRIFKSHLINLTHVVRYSKVEGGAVVMTDDAHLPIADNKKDELRNSFL